MTCYTDQGGTPCGKPTVAQIAIIPVGGPVTGISEGRINLCMRHLLILMYSNGVGAGELADVIDSLGAHIARQIIADGKTPPVPSARRDDSTGGAQ